MLTSYLKNKVKGYTLSLNTLIVLLIGSVILLIIIVAIYFTVVPTIKDLILQQEKTGKKIPNTLPSISGIAIIRYLNRFKSSLGIKTIFYLLLGIFIALMLILAVKSFSDKAKEGNVEIRDIERKVNCPKKCLGSENYNECYEECIKGNENAKTQQNRSEGSS